MEQWEVIAVDKNAYIRFKHEGRQIDGIRLLLKGAAPTGDRERFLGFNWQDQFISNERLQKLSVAPRPGDLIEIHFNRYGDIERIDIAEGK